VNFGSHLRDARGTLIRPGEPGYLPPSTRPYAAQKAFSPVAGAIDCTLWKYFSRNVKIAKKIAWNCGRDQYLEI